MHSESAETSVARLEGRMEGMQSALENVSRRLASIEAKLDNGCPFGQNLRDRVSNVEDDLWGDRGIKARLTELERWRDSSRARLSGGWQVVLIVVGGLSQIVSWGIAIWAVVGK